MNTKSIAILNLQSGEILDTKHKFRDTRFKRRGQGMYNRGVIELLDVLSKDEIKRIVSMYSSDNVDMANIFVNPFRSMTAEMSRSSRSNFKKKLIDSRIIGEFNKKLMLNPFIFMPRTSKSIRNNQYLTQLAWEWLFEDNTKYDDELQDFVEHSFDYKFNKSGMLYVGSKQDGKFIPEPNNPQLDAN